MKKISDMELENISGGGLTFWGAMGIAAVVTFIAGVLDGFTRPLKCN